MMVMNMYMYMNYNNLYSDLLIESYGNQFQENFEKLMFKYYPNFKKVQAYGNSGDKGNDGFLQDDGIFFQVYGPISMSSSIEKNILQKIQKDIEKLVNASKEKFWENVVEWIFVYNDFGKGITPKISQKLNEMSEKYGIKCHSWGINDLVNKFSALPSHEKEELLNLPPCMNYNEMYIQDQEHWQMFKKEFGYLLNEIKAERIWFGKTLEKKLFCVENTDFAIFNFFEIWNRNFIFFFFDEKLNKYYKEFQKQFYCIWNDAILRYYIYIENIEKYCCIRFDENVEYIKKYDNDFHDSHSSYMKQIYQFQNQIYNLLNIYMNMENRILELNSSINPL